MFVGWQPDGRCRRSTRLRTRHPAAAVDVAFVEVNSLTRATTVLDFTDTLGDVSDKAVTCPSLGDHSDGQGLLTCFLDDRSSTGYVWIATVNSGTGEFIYGASR